MKLPRFSADLSLFKTDRCYHAARTGAGLTSRAFPAQLDFEPDEVVGETGEDCLSACLDAGGSEDECAEECSSIEGAEEP